MATRSLAVQNAIELVRAQSLSVLVEKARGDALLVQAVQGWRHRPALVHDKLATVGKRAPRP
jgi:hypothetical protein